jgi:hypothetical protein
VACQSIFVVPKATQNSPNHPHEFSPFVQDTLVLTPSEEKLSYVVLKATHMVFRLC